MSKKCKFQNNTDLPVFVESWINNSGLSTMSGLTVEPGKIKEIPSITGEWYLHNFLPELAHFKLWKEAGYDYIDHIGKFRDEPAYDQKISWMDFDEFSVKLVNGVYVFSKNS